jgi:hypothetical protein
MLKSIDILIGVAVVMLVISAVVTALTQFFLHVMQSKGKELRTGVADLLQQIAPKFERACAERIADAVLKHPLVRRSEGQLSDTIHREELVKILFELATATEGHKLGDDDRNALKEALKAGGIPDPETILKNARSLLLHFEMSNPELSNAVRANLALLQEASSDFLARVHAWFDQTIDRTVDRFTAGTRTVTFCCAVAVVLFLQLDTVALINQLSMDSQLRNTLVQQALQVNASGPSTANPSGTPDTPAIQQLRNDIDANQDQIRDLASLGLIRLPHSVNDWVASWTTGNSVVKIFGLLMSAILLSLGAPFWYNALKTLIGLRSIVAGKDDQQRKDRQTLTPESPEAAAAMTAAVGQPALVGERGSLG